MQSGCSLFFFSSRRRHTRFDCDWSSDVCSSDLGRVTLIMGQVEMGQGMYTAMPQLLAEELEVGLDQVRLEHAPPDEKRYANPLFHFQATGGSTSVMGLRSEEHTSELQSQSNLVCRL